MKNKIIEFDERWHTAVAMGSMQNESIIIFFFFFLFAFSKWNETHSFLLDLSVRLRKHRLKN